jgi:hypothetical protein
MSEASPQAAAESAVRESSALHSSVRGARRDAISAVIKDGELHKGA